MVAPIILISSDSSDESVGSSSSRIILFGTILTEIPTETHVIPPVAPEAETARVASPAGVLDLITYSSTDSNTSEDLPSPEHFSTIPATLPFLRTDSFEAFDSDSSDRPLSLDSHETVYSCLARPGDTLGSHLRTLTMWLVLRGDNMEESTPIYHARVQWSLTTSVPSAIPDLGALSPTYADLLPLRKRFRSSSARLSIEASIEGSIEIGSEEEDIDSDILADIDADIAAKAATAGEFRVETDVGVEGDEEAKEEAESSAKGTIEIRIERATELEITEDIPAPVTDEGDRETFDIGLDVVIQELYDHMVDILVQRIADVEEEQRRQEVRALSDKREMTRLRERDSMLEGSNMRLRGALAEER
ncbi:hypothetical protein Tco_0727454 [Tanacetum coccineum]|uniref:Uncharacterized protein n=1 Tax=Tanacetum coccineum TaxID=301880 RepID=A0ABQ4YKQ5_9ASTR